MTYQCIGGQGKVHMTRKVCTRCGSRREETQFRLIKGQRKRRIVCKVCENLMRKVYIREKKQQDREWYLWYQAKQRAREKGREFTITPDDIIIPSHCPYIGTELHPSANKKSHRWCNIISLDRIDNTRGYTPDNVEVISLLANNMKAGATPTELLSFARHILEHFWDVP